MNLDTQTAALDVEPSVSTFGGIPLQGMRHLEMVHGLPGFEDLKKFVLAELAEYAPFCALQSVEESSISMLVIDAKLLNVWQEIDIPPRELSILGLEQSPEAEQYVILKVNQATQEFTANIKAPIVFNPKTGAANQVILDNAELSVEHPIQHELTD